MAVLRMLVLLVLWSALPTLSFGFVEQLSPNGGPIPCHQMKAAILYYIEGVYTAGQLGNALEAKYLTPQGGAWSATDNTDNSNLVALITGITHADPVVQRLSRYRVAVMFEASCAAWEHAFPAVDTPNEFRTRVGIPTQ